MQTVKAIHYLTLPVMALSACLSFQCARVTDNSEDGIFDIYLVRDTSICPSLIDSISITTIDLPTEPVATLDDITTYQIFRSNSGRSLVHSITFKSEMKAQFGYDNCCFVVVVDGVRMYQGEYWANFMSTYPSSVIIHTYTTSEFHIIANEEGIDKINDPVIIQTFIDSGVDLVYINTGTP